MLRIYVTNRLLTIAYRGSRNTPVSGVSNSWLHTADYDHYVPGGYYHCGNEDRQADVYDLEGRWTQEQA